MAYRVAAPRASTSCRRRGGYFTLSRSCSGSGRRGRSPLRRRRAVFPRSRPTRAPILYSSGAAAAEAVLSPLVGPPPPLYTTVQTSTGGFGEGGGPGAGVGANGQRRLESAYTSDELCISYSAGMLGSFSPYRSSPYPRELTCFECQAVQHHYAMECPLRFVRVRGEAPPGWKVDSPGRAAKDESAWNGSELTDAARARYSEFITKLSLQPHVAFLVTVDDIVGPAPVPNRRPIPRPGRGRGR